MQVSCRTRRPYSAATTVGRSGCSPAAICSAPAAALLEQAKSCALVLDGKTGPEDLHQIYEGESAGHVQLIHTERAAA